MHTLTRLGVAAISACIFLFFGQTLSQAKPWRGIVPLQSTRSDVERILGSPVMDRNVYDAPDGRAIITYSDGSPCEVGLPGLGNIPKETVVEIYLTLSQPIELSQLLSPAKHYVRMQLAHTPSISYVFDEDDGVRYSTQGGVVRDLSYFGTAAEKKRFVCSEPQYARPIPKDPDALRVDYPTFDEYGKIRFEDAKARLDNFVIQLLQSNEKRKDYLGYIIVYGGKTGYRDEAKRAANSSKDYLVKVRHADPDTIVAVDGGYREEFEVDLFIGPASAYPPVLYPTVSPTKVTFLK